MYVHQQSEHCTEHTDKIDSKEEERNNKLSIHK